MCVFLWISRLVTVTSRGANARTANSARRPAGPLARCKFSATRCRRPKLFAFAMCKTSPLLHFRHAQVFQPSVQRYRRRSRRKLRSIADVVFHYHGPW